MTGTRDEGYLWSNTATPTSVTGSGSIFRPLLGQESGRDRETLQLENHYDLIVGRGLSTSQQSTPTSTQRTDTRMHVRQPYQHPHPHAQQQHAYPSSNPTSSPSSSSSTTTTTAAPNAFPHGTDFVFHPGGLTGISQSSQGDLQMPMYATTATDMSGSFGTNGDPLLQAMGGGYTTQPQPQSFGNADLGAYGMHMFEPQYPGSQLSRGLQQQQQPLYHHHHQHSGQQQQQQQLPRQVQGHTHQQPPLTQTQSGQRRPSTTPTSNPNINKRPRYQEIPPQDDSDHDDQDQDGDDDGADDGGDVSPGVAGSGSGVGAGAGGAGGAEAKAKPPGACQRCKNLKVRCEFKTDPSTCKRCLNGGHYCTIPGRRKRRPPP
ncbi:hypothetical protein BD410DRAFT_550423 [Rickenella mellea]|uniref:Zn(2)-C6 fungal-type domain-containing protein n=1 Tax=Rickenella mellea TaxID=50990 RepID=A0A4Y7PQT5_9AGAM|nr:hypothetical protein BD410DRAFT_550423 [Rickenella mellea]